MTLLMSPTHLTTCCRHVGMLAADMSDWGSSRHNTMLTILTKRDRQHHGEPNSTFQCMRLKRSWACSLSIWGIGAIVNVLHLHHKLFRNLHQPCQHHQWSRIKDRRGEFCFSMHKTSKMVHMFIEYLGFWPNCHFFTSHALALHKSAPTMPASPIVKETDNIMKGQFLLFNAYGYKECEHALWVIGVSSLGICTNHVNIINNQGSRIEEGKFCI